MQILILSIYYHKRPVGEQELCGQALPGVACHDAVREGNRIKYFIQHPGKFTVLFNNVRPAFVC